MDGGSETGRPSTEIPRSCAIESAAPSNWTGLSAASYNGFQFNATLIPEPSRILLTGAGTIPIARHKRRRQC